MKTVIYDYRTLKVLRVTDEDVCITSLRDNEDMMPVSLWNEGINVEPIAE